MLDRFLARQQRTEHVGVELAAEFFGGGLFDRHVFVDAGIVHQHVEPAERFFGFIEQALDIGGLNDVAFHRDRLAAFCGDLGDNAFGVGLAGGIVHHHGGAGRAQGLGDSRADTLRRAGDDRHLAFQITH